MIKPERLPCPCCGRDIGLTRAGVRLMPHKNADRQPCAGSRAPVELLPAITAAANDTSLPTPNGDPR